MEIKVHWETRVWEAGWSTGQQCTGLRMERSWVLVLAGSSYHVLEVLYSDRAWVLANCLVKLTECWEIPCTGPTSNPGESGMTPRHFMLQKPE